MKKYIISTLASITLFSVFTFANEIQLKPVSAPVNLTLDNISYAQHLSMYTSNGMDSATFIYIKNSDWYLKIVRSEGIPSIEMSSTI